MLNKIAQITLSNLRAVFCLFALILMSSCSRQGYSNNQLYNTPGFDPGTLPNAPNQGAPIRRVSPDYYYRQPSYAPPQRYAPPPQNSYYGGGNVTPGSRFYSNPYAIPPSTQYPYYDADQYYVPPTYYRNIEQDQRSPAQVQQDSGAGVGTVNQKY